MSFFSKMGFFEKVAFCVSLPILGPVAVVGAAYEGVTGKKVFSDSDSSSNHNEDEARELVERQAKEKRSAEERKAIVGYAKKGLMALQTVHASTEQPIAVSLSFPELKRIVQSDQPPIEILERWIPQAPGSDFASSALREVNQLNKEIKELKQLRQAVLNYQPEDVSA